MDLFQVPLPHEGWLEGLRRRGLEAASTGSVHWVDSTPRRGWARRWPKAEYERMFEALGKPAHGTLVFHWARLIELLYAAERAVELASDPEITSTKVRNQPGEPGEGIGIVEAARGTLVHHYHLDKEALVKKVNMIVATTNNYPAICMSIRDAAKGLIHGGKVDKEILNKVEMAFRAYDPCFGCATHFAIGQMPLEVKVFDHSGRLVDRLER